MTHKPLLVEPLCPNHHKWAKGATGDECIPSNLARSTDPTRSSAYSLWSTQRKARRRVLEGLPPPEFFVGLRSIQHFLKTKHGSWWLKEMLDDCLIWCMRLLASNSIWLPGWVRARMLEYFYLVGQINVVHEDGSIDQPTQLAWSGHTLCFWTVSATWHCQPNICFWIYKPWITFYFLRS
jgi:hypothetical protein